MPNCRHCGSRITKFDKDMCPVCGGKLPLDGVSSDTIEVTSEISLSNEGFKTKKKLTFVLLSCLIGWTGASFYYLKQYKAGIIWLIINVALLAGGFVGLYFTPGINLALAILIPLLIVYTANIAYGLIINFKSVSLKDRDGNYLR